ncbi:CHAT domain-containing protein [Nannocystis exedens]|uniref:CHAT domain-containing protein n=1 Tax=Nannocystis exedens TaxID=54 RepID=A0A1I1YYX4_9BACT|nr:CHAT domain-containing protein [Nannocystis exedens]PCC70125.1 CHAT domain protein [Nannocystis exedens]SFE23230.1 CHAT domain-containing protein [Nannocystis exedens]
MKSPIHQLHQFLLDRFTSSELRQFALFYWEGVSQKLPGESISHADLCMQLCTALQRLGLIDADLFALLERERPRFRPEIDQLRRHFQAADASTPAADTSQPLIAFVAANPIALPALRLAEEARDIEDKLRTTGARFRFQSTWCAGPDELLDALVETSPDILHFAGHGGRNGALLLQTAEGGAHPVAPAALAGLVAARPWKPRLVVLNCCYSAVLANALRPHVDAVIGMRDEVPDDVGRRFAVQLYRALAQRDSLATAFDTARAALRVYNLAADHLPQLTVRGAVDPQRYRLF